MILIQNNNYFLAQIKTLQKGVNDLTVWANPKDKLDREQDAKINQFLNNLKTRALI